MLRFSYLLPVILGVSAYPFQDPINPPNTEERIAMAGYPAETHQILTQDRYILTAFRIPRGKNSIGTEANPEPLVLQHGILCSSDCWVLSENGLGFILADAGFDVWLTNSRGNTYSRGHLNYTTKDKEFWDFSFHEVGFYDIPAQIDHILRKTGAKRLTYVGHSQGTATFFVFGATRPEYRAKVRGMAALAPVAYLDHTKGAVKEMSKISGRLIEIAHFLGINHLLDRSVILGISARIICKVFPKICEDVIDFIVGFDSPHFDKSLMPFLADICPTGASLKQLVHFNQLTKNGGRFCWYDYGEKENILKYNSSEPPAYNLTSINIPILLYYGPNDYIASVSEVKHIYHDLPNVKDIQKISSYNHLDFMWAIDAFSLLYKPMIVALKNL